MSLDYDDANSALVRVLASLVHALLFARAAAVAAIDKEEVTGSSPREPTILFKSLRPFLSGVRLLGHCARRWKPERPALAPIRGVPQSLPRVSWTAAPLPAALAASAVY